MIIDSPEYIQLGELLEHFDGIDPAIVRALSNEDRKIVNQAIIILEMIYEDAEPEEEEEEE